MHNACVRDRVIYVCLTCENACNRRSHTRTHNHTHAHVQRVTTQRKTHNVSSIRVCMMHVYRMMRICMHDVLHACNHACVCIHVLCVCMCVCAYDIMCNACMCVIHTLLFICVNMHDVMCMYVICIYMYMSDDSYVSCVICVRVVCVRRYMRPHVYTPSRICFFAPAAFRNSDNVRVQGNPLLCRPRTLTYVL